MDNQRKIILDIPAITILKIVGVLLGLLLVYLVRDIIVLFFVVLVIVAALSPVVDRWSRSMPRSLAVTFIYLILLAVIVGIGLLIIPPAVSQIQSLAENPPHLFTKLGPIYDTYKDTVGKISEQGLASISGQLGRLGSSLVSTTVGVFGGLVAAFTVLVLSFYLLLEEQGAKTFFKSILPPTYKESALEAANKISIKMGAWLRGQLLLMLIVGFLSTIGLLILDVPYALTLGLWAGLTEVIAYVGPFLGLIPAAIIGFSQSPLQGILVIAVYLLIQQIEAQVLVPKIMGKAVGLSPIIIIFAILVGAKLFGTLGVVLAVPAAGALAVIYQEWPKLKGLK